MNEYWIILQEQYQQLATRVNQAVLRERILLLIILVTIIYASWSLLFIFPGHKAINLAKTTEKALVEQVIQLEQTISTIEKNTVNLSASGAIPKNSLISESAVISMFKSILTKYHGITLKGLYNLPDQPLNLSASIPLYEQGITLIFNSGYSDFYEYLRSLENLKWMLFWDELQYAVTKYPSAEIKLTTYTVSSTKED